MRFRTLLTATLAATLTVACSADPFAPIASVRNIVDTVALGALHGTPVGVPSAYSVSNSRVIFTESVEDNQFDFAFDFDSVQGPAFYPTGLFPTIMPPSATNPGLKRTVIPFDSIKIADQNGYITNKIMPVDSGDIFLARSAISCSQGVPQYAKIEILSIDTAGRGVTFRVLTDNNCGYRGLQTGIPKH